MLSSMQRNKKWLLPTIWISTIAFVGAGFVGWGSYNPSASSSNIVATVGKKEIPLKNLQQEYSNLYSQYQQSLGDQFNQELAKQFNLEKIAYNNIVQRYLLLNLSDEFGFTVSNDEIFKELVKIPSFVKDEKFDKEAYKSILKQNRTTPSDFEEQVKNDILLKKIREVYTTNTNENTMKNLNELFFASDKVQINIISADDINIDTSEANINEFFNKNKENYKSIEKYEVNVAKIKINEDEKKSKKDALKMYLKLKKSQASFSSKEFLDINSEFLSIEEQNTIFTSELGSILKPLKVGDSFVIYQLIKKIQPQVQALNDVIEKVKKDYKIQKTNEILNSKKDELLKNFTGTDIGYITRGELKKIDGLDEKEINLLSQKISMATSLVDFIQLDNKIVVFKILDTKLATYDKSKDKYLRDTIIKLKDNQIMTSIIKNLENKYIVTSNYKVK